MFRFGVGFVCLLAQFHKESDLFLGVSAAEIVFSICRAEFREVRVGH